MSLEFFLMIVIPEVLLFSVWTFACVSSMQTMEEVAKKKPKKKKEKVKELRKVGDYYPFDYGEALPDTDF